jgi:hypothetical protein
VGFVLIIERLNILQALERFSFDLPIGLADEIIQRDLQGVSDLAGDLDGRFYLIAFILADNIPRGADLFT